MKPYLIIINHRTWIALTVGILTILLCFTYSIQFDLDLTLISIAIIFPLVFTIRGSFRRREKALEHLSEFRAALKTVNYFMKSSKRLQPEHKEAIGLILVDVSAKVMGHLKNNLKETTELDKCLEQVYLFIDEQKDYISEKHKDKLFRVLKDLHESVENVHAINIHRTPISLKAYCLIFIYIFPLIYVPTVIHQVGPEQSQWITYFLVLITQFILISLYNIQHQLEYPFDDKGLDDIQLNNFKIDR